MRRSFLTGILLVTPLLVPSLLVATSTRASAQIPRIGAIDFYGGRTVSQDVVLRALGLHVGDTITVTKDTLLARIRRVRGVADARVAIVCCDDAGKSLVYVGVREATQPPMSFRTAPTGDIRLPAEVLSADSATSVAMMEGIQKGANGEDDSRGYSVFAYPAAREQQQRLIDYAPAHIDLLRNVLEHSSSAEHRALAAQMLPMAQLNARTIQDLANAMHDPDSGVRNNAMRALSIIAAYAPKHPEANLTVPLTGFSEMLNSVEWTDRNKAAFALMQLTASRDPALLAELASTSMDALVDMARWHALGHAMPGLIILGRIAGIDDQKTFEMMQKDRESVIAAARAKVAAQRR